MIIVAGGPVERPPTSIAGVITKHKGVIAD